MEGSIRKPLHRYWVLYFQPAPEAGERISIAVAIEDHGGVRIEYDRKFAKARKLYSGLDVDVLSFYLESLAQELALPHEGADQSAVLASYGPQLMPSHVRLVAAPITEATVAMLLNKYVFLVKFDQIRALAAAAQDAAQDPVAKEIEAFVVNRVGHVAYRAFASPHDIVGHSVRGAKPVAMAVPNPGGWTLLDGVDLNTLTASGAIKRANEISRTFWNYAQLSSSGGEIKSVGIVLNGNSHLAKASAEAHDYILHRFQSDADEAIDASSTESEATLRRLLAPVSVR